MEQHVLPLYHIHRHVGEADVVFHEVGHRDHGLDHVVHQQELLSILQVSLGEVHIRARVDGAALLEVEKVEKIRAFTDNNDKAYSELHWMGKSGIERLNEHEYKVNWRLFARVCIP